MARNDLLVTHDTYRRKYDVKVVSTVVRFRYYHCCVSVIMRPSGYFISVHLVLGAI